MTVHKPILLSEILELLTPAVRDASGPGPIWWLDCTLGGGGHTAAFLKEAAELDPDAQRIRVLSVDRDGEAVARARERFRAEISQKRLEIQHTPFGSIDLEGKRVFAILADLGISSDQLEDGTRGIGFQTSGPLDMRMDTSQGETAWELLRRVTERELADLIFEWGEERLSRPIARAIVRARQDQKLQDSANFLAELISRSVPPSYRHGRIHPATRTFQALRIAVNGELEQLDLLLTRVLPLLQVGGRAALMSFHSLEDRAVKQGFRALAAAQDSSWEILTKKPIEASDGEIRENPRSRSAKLRCIARVNIGKMGAGT